MLSCTADTRGQAIGKFLRLAWRNIWRNWRRTLIALLAIALRLLQVLFSNSILDGSERAAFGNAVRLQGGNVQVHAPGYWQKAKRLPLYPLDDAEAIVQTALAHRDGPPPRAASIPAVW